MDYICSETLCTRLQLLPTVENGTTIEIIEGINTNIAVAKSL
jgi:hypothetical protein